MKRDTSWASLFKPGEQTKYFTTTNIKPVQLNAGDFSLLNAWYLAEASHLVYRPDFHTDKTTDTGSVHYELISYIENSETSTHVAIIKVLQDSPCLFIVFRGTDEAEDWGINVRIYQDDFNNKGKVHTGFKKAYLSIQDQLFYELEFSQTVLPAAFRRPNKHAAIGTNRIARHRRWLNLNIALTNGATVGKTIGELTCRHHL